jgi:NAD(P)H-flavin reductase/2-polyprenyl-6-methoxyphenol hydroxylase-like FAD-dependent oxidoreductase/ferredoxin
MTHEVTVRYADGAERRMSVAGGQTVLEAAEASGVPIVNECQSGVCGTCVGRCTRGVYVLGQAVGLSQQEREQGRVLTCQTRVESDCLIEVDYPLEGNAASLMVGEVLLARVERLSPETALLVIDVSSLPEALHFRPGQFAQLNVPGTDQWRSYSFAHAPRASTEVEFLIRLLPRGVMSDYLAHRAQPGDRLGFRGSKGGFYLRDAGHPVLLMAGGTGLSAILAIAEQLVRERAPQPIHLNYGVKNAADLVLLSRLERLATQHAGFTWRCIAQDPSLGWSGQIGLVTDLLENSQLHGGRVDIYLCGPPAMVDATRRWVQSHGHGNANVYFEKFLPSGTRPVGEAESHAAASVDARAARERGRGTAVVIGGSMAGMATAKVLTESFARVIVLEKDQDHRRKEGRPGAAQGWHLHHLLIAGQRQLDSVFPGIIDDMVRAGAFKVDMGEQYRIMLAGSWKKVETSGIEIVCAGRPLLEWCVRRRLDDEPTVEYHYESEVTDLLFDAATQSVVGVTVAREGRHETIPAELVVDASGKNTPVPAILYRLGIGAPTIEEDCVNCFYSTMQHRVPPERAWRDKVMIICYAQRPQQHHYAAQYFTDSSRTVLSTSLVAYNCYRPPRNAEEFRAFAQLMPSHVIGSELDGLEPCSPVYNFRYPEMRRFHYEDMQNLPAGLVAVGDAYCSADPVSGAGMTKALLELNELRTLLRTRPVRERAFVRGYYASVSRIADRVWAVIREQNLRYPWIKDVGHKRPVGFGLHNWYVDRIFELLHEDPDIYRLYLLVTHFVEPPSTLMRPAVVARVLGRWLRRRLTLRKSLLERNFGKGRMGEWDAPLP